MAKILLVEDDNNLREIYEARLMAEGYDIVSARDGEEALSVAIKEKPDLVISDVMMPKISGFDMLDILRTTEETKNVKVIMMTALSQAEDKARAEKLGADRYLVKSQVTLEDVAKVAKEVLEGGTAPVTTPAPVVAAEPVAAPAAPAAPAPTPEPVVAPAAASTPDPVVPTPAPAPAEPTPTPVAPASDLPVVPTPADEDAANEPAPEPHPSESTMDAEEQAIAKQLESIISQSVGGATAPVTTPAPAAPTEPVAAPSEPATPAPAAESTAPTASTDPAPASEKDVEPAAVAPTARKVISPINDLSADMKPKLDELAAKEEAKETADQSIPIQTEGSVAPTVPAPQEETAKDDKVDPNLIAL